MKFQEWLKLKEINEFTKLEDWLSLLDENSRYSVEVNYRTKKEEILEGFVKICLGFVSAAMKQDGFHVKHVYDKEPLRIIVSSRNWDDGEWCGIISYNHKEDGGAFIISKGFFNKERKTISLQSNKKCNGTSANELSVELRKMMFELKEKKDRHVEKMKGVPLKRGPKR